MTRAPKERPYHCRLCNRAVAEDELGYVCQHVAHGMMLTLVPDASSDGTAPVPDTACTACVLAMEQQKKGAEDEADIHVVCVPCYRDVRKRNIDDFTAADRERGYVLATRAQYERLEPRPQPLDIGVIHEGRMVKLGFSPIPSASPISLERMWVNVSSVLKGGVLHGVLANDPELFKRKTLKANDTVIFAAKHILDVIPETKAEAMAFARKAEQAKDAAKEKIARERAAAKAKAEKAREKVAKEKARAKEKSAKERAKLAKEKARERAQAGRERARLAKEKERERQKARAAREKAAKQRKKAVAAAKKKKKKKKTISAKKRRR